MKNTDPEGLIMFCIWISFVLLIDHAWFCTGSVYLPVYDVRTNERFDFDGDYLRLVITQQARLNASLAVYAQGPLDLQGYIINEQGQLVPFRIFKKGNLGHAMMCQLHPRNCRTGGRFRKRMFDETTSYDNDQLLYLLEKRDNQPPGKDDFNMLYATGNDDIFDPGYDVDDDDSTEGYSNRKELLQEIQNEILTDSAKSNTEMSDSYPQLGDLITMNALASKPDRNNKKLLHNPGKRAKADPPSLETKLRAAAVLLAYPEYEWQATDNDNLHEYSVDPHTSDFFRRRRRRR